MASATKGKQAPSGDESKTGGARPILLVALLVAVLVAGASLALYLGDRSPGEGSAEAGFARDMMDHHAQAVQMAEIVTRRTESQEMRLLATDMMLTQQAQIGQMQGWLGAWELPLTGTEPAMAWMGHPTDGLMPGMATQEQISRLESLPPEEADREFLRLMIPHHRAAVPMAEAVLDETDRPEVEQLAQAIAASQGQEIRNMRGMLEDMSETPPEPMQDHPGDHPGRDG